MDINGQLSIWDLMSQEAGEDPVEIKGAYNVHSKGSIKQFEVTLTTGDLVLLVSMIEDYIRGLDEIKKDDLLWETYYRGKFSGMSKRIQEQIDYNYDKARAKCLKKTEKEDDIGEEAVALAVKRAMRAAKEGT